MAETYWQDAGSDPAGPFLNGDVHTVTLHDGMGMVTVCDMLTCDLFATPEAGAMLMRRVEGPATCTYCLAGERHPRAEMLDDEDEDEDG